MNSICVRSVRRLGVVILLILMALSSFAQPPPGAPPKKPGRRRPPVLDTTQVQDHGYLGLTLMDLDDTTRQELKYTGTGGALVAEVVKGSAAERAGIKENDVVTRFHEKTISDKTQLRQLFGETNPGDSVNVELFRGGEALTIKVGMGSLRQALAQREKTKPKPLEDRGESQGRQHQGRRGRGNPNDEPGQPSGW